MLLEHYFQSENLHGCRLLIIPCANPDGIAEGTINDGFGRCNAYGIDLNRDFDAEHAVFAVIAGKDVMAQIISPLDNGGYKIGWIESGKTE